MMNLVVALLLSASPELEEGRLHMAALRYKAAVTSLSKVADHAQAPVAERLEANDLLARAHLALGSAAKAEQAYEALLALDPMAEEPKAAPKVVAAFRRAKERRFPRDTVLLERRARSVELVEVRVVNPWRLTVHAELMVATGETFSPRRIELDEKLVGIATLVPGSRYYLRCVNAEGKVLASVGSALEPFAGPPATPPPPPVVTVTTADAPTKEQPPPLPTSDRAPVATTTPRQSRGVLDPVLNPQVLPISRSMPLGRVAGWALLVGGVVLALAGGGVIAWGLFDIDRANRWIEYDDLDPISANRLKREAEARVLFGGIGAGVGAVAAIIGSVLLGVSPSESAPETN
ncbi:MAG: bacterial transcriptional activator domain-containing protein [Myxococcaceae bacterium]|nr:bacterial transcriptional activator domain-containing protein [Myxococcaceae bacterium]